MEKMDKRSAYKQDTECPECKQAFKGTVGRATHMRKAHRMNPDGSKYHLPVAIVVKPKTKREKDFYASKQGKQGLRYEDSEPIQLYAYITAHLESIIHRVAFEHDLPEKQFAQGFARYLHRP